jgi:hypothetical protein
VAQRRLLLCQPGGHARAPAVRRRGGPAPPPPVPARGARAAARRRRGPAPPPPVPARGHTRKPAARGQRSAHPWQQQLESEDGD